MSKVTDYLRETKGEMKHVSWPTRQQVINFTMLVVAISVLVSIFLGFFDFIFTFLLEKFIL